MAPFVLPNLDALDLNFYRNNHETLDAAGSDRDPRRRVDRMRAGNENGREGRRYHGGHAQGDCEGEGNRGYATDTRPCGPGWRERRKGRARKIRRHDGERQSAKGREERLVFLYRLELLFGGLRAAIPRLGEPWYCLACACLDRRHGFRRGFVRQPPDRCEYRTPGKLRITFRDRSLHILLQPVDARVVVPPRIAEKLPVERQHPVGETRQVEEARP